jgi:hypothetical protein
MHKNWNRILLTVAGTAMSTALVAAAQTAAPAAPTAAPAAPAPAAPTWSVGSIDFSGFIDGYYSYNFNTPSNANNGQVNDLYNFNDKTDQFNLSAAKLTLNHDPDPVGVHIDFLFGRTEKLVNYTNDSNYIEQAYVSMKPPKAKGFELDFGKFVTSAGAEVIEAKDNWNYSRSILFVYALPYYHFGARTSMPVSKIDTIGVQVVNGWNNTTKDHSGATLGLTNSLVKPKYTWNLNYYVGPENAGTTDGLRNLIDTTLLLTPCPKFSAYLNYDYGQNRDAKSAQGDTLLKRWQGVAFAAHGAVSATQTLSARYEYYKDYQGFMTGSAQTLQEFTGTYEYKWAAGLLSRIELRHDWSNVSYFHKNDNALALVDGQTTITASFIAFFGPKR